jgi:hypothetical protein
LPMFLPEPVTMAVLPRSAESRLVGSVIGSLVLS